MNELDDASDPNAMWVGSIKYVGKKRRRTPRHWYVKDWAKDEWEITTYYPTFGMDPCADYWTRDGFFTAIQRDKYNVSRADPQDKESRALLDEVLNTAFVNELSAFFDECTCDGHSLRCYKALL